MANGNPADVGGVVTLNSAKLLTTVGGPPGKIQIFRSNSPGWTTGDCTTKYSIRECDSGGTLIDGGLSEWFDRSSTYDGVKSGAVYPEGIYVRIRATLYWNIDNSLVSYSNILIYHTAGTAPVTTVPPTTVAPQEYLWLADGAWNSAGDPPTGTMSCTANVSWIPAGELDLYDLWFRIASYNPATPDTEDGVYFEEQHIAAPNLQTSQRMTTATVFPRDKYVKISGHLMRELNSISGASILINTVPPPTTTAAPSTTMPPFTTEPPIDYPVWPAGLPAPQWTKYGAEYQDIVVRSPMDSGPGKTRRKYSLAVEYVTCSWVFTYPQMEEFQNFFTADVAYGALWFIWQRPENNETLLARFKKPPNRTMMIPSVQVDYAEPTTTTGEPGTTTVEPPATTTRGPYKTDDPMWDASQWIHSLWEITAEVEIKHYA